MSGILNGGGGGFDISQLSQMLGQARKDPFARAMPGEALLGNNPMSPPQQQMPGMMPSLPGLPGGLDNLGGGGIGAPPQGFNSVSTDFADTQPGLPNLPDSFGGFGFGQFAPQMNQGNPLRQQLISQLMGNMQQMQGGGQQMPGMMPQFGDRRMPQMQGNGQRQMPGMMPPSMNRGM